MKVAVFGRGKTGQHVIDFLGEQVGEIFHRDNPPKKQQIEGHDAVIVFVPSETFFQFLGEFAAAKVPVVLGATGGQWSKDQLQSISDLIVVHGHNFSLGMNVIRHLFAKINNASKLLSNFTYNIHEVHHTKKLDAPSGTAIKWQEWLGLGNINITHERTGDVIGVHELTLQSQEEKIQIRHESLDRKLFARGAVWAVQQILNNQSFPKGLTHFEDLVDQSLQEGSVNE